MIPKVELAAMAYDHLGHYHGSVSFVDDSKSVFKVEFHAIWWGSVPCKTTQV